MKIKDIILPDGLIRGPFGSDMSKDKFINESKDSIKVLTQENIFKKSQDIGTYFISQAYYQKMKRFEVNENDILVTCDGTLGEIYYVANLKQKSVINSSLLIFRLNPTIINYQYFCYFWEIVLKNKITKRNVNSCLKHLPSISVIKDESINLPNLNEQIKVVNSVQPIDKKIELNNQIIYVLINKIKESNQCYIS